MRDIIISNVLQVLRARLERPFHIRSEGDALFLDRYADPEAVIEFLARDLPWYGQMDKMAALSQQPSIQQHIGICHEEPFVSISLRIGSRLSPIAILTNPVAAFEIRGVGTHVRLAEIYGDGDILPHGRKHADTAE